MKPRPSKTPPQAPPAEDRSVLSLLRQVQTGEVHPSNLASPDRQAVVEHLTAEGYSTAETAEILKTSERTIARDRKTIREVNAVARDPELAEQMVGELFQEAHNCMCRIRRAARDKEATPAVRVDAEHRAYQILSDLVVRLQGFGYLPSVGQKIKAELTHQIVESDDPAVLEAEILRLTEIAVESGGAGAQAPIEGLRQMVKALPGVSEAPPSQPSNKEHEDEPTK